MAERTGAADVDGCRASANGNVTNEVYFAAAYCFGVVDAVLWMISPGIGDILCKPKGVTTTQGLQVLVKYMDDHPEELNERTIQLAERAFLKAWPCRQKTQ
jgi:hypothetical protein